jgi:flavin reductase (DIM6/NTAB) family NADH-FMN oxidoreductase RutF
VSTRAATDTDEKEASRVDPRAFRSVCGNFATGVAVVTSGTTESVSGLTVNSFTSVSLDPPLILVCIQNDSSELPALQRSGAFAVNILAADQEDLCRAYASWRTRHLVDAEVHCGVTGVPILSAALAYLECRIEREVDGGDHEIVIGEVVALDVQRDDGPLTYFRSGYHRLTPVGR